MKLADLLAERKEVILDRWFDLIVKTYPGLSAVFLKKNHRWGNPVGTHIHGALIGIFEQLQKPAADKEIAPLVDKVIRIRTVQDYMPSEAVAILLLIKHVVREQCADEFKSGQIEMKEAWEFDARVDSMLLLAFDMYTKCRNEIMELRLNDFKQRFTGILRMKNIVVDYPKFTDGSSEK